MRIWEALIFFLSLWTSDLLILNGISKFENDKKVPIYFLLLYLLCSLGYGALQYFTQAFYQDLYLVTHIVFFLNNLWLLIFFRNSVVRYNDTIPIGRYFVFSILIFLIPISVGMYFNPVQDFQLLMLELSYLLGIIPMVVYTSMLAGISVGSAVWGIIIACFLFTADFFLRYNFFALLSTDFRMVISEVIRACLVLLVSVFGRLGHMIPPGTNREVILGTQKLNNLFFGLIALFPVMIFYTVFWQVNLNDRKIQQKEIQLSKDIFLISSKMLEDQSESYLRILKEAQDSTSLATAQWKLKTFLFTNPEIEIAQLLTSYPITYQDQEILFERGKITFYSRTKHGWGIKLVINMELLYPKLPLNDSQRLYVFLENTSLLFPVARPMEREAVFYNLDAREYVFTNTLTLFEKTFQAFLIFQTSPATVNLFTILFLLGAILVLVLIWWFYGFFVHQWEAKAREKVLSLNRAKQEYGEQVGRLENSLKLISGDLEITSDKLDQFSQTVYQLTDSFSNFDFQKGPTYELKILYDKLLSIMNWLDQIIFFQKNEEKGKVLAFSGSEPAFASLPVSFVKNGKELSTGFLEGIPSKTVAIDKRDFVLMALLKNKNYDPSEYEFHFLRTLFNISELYLKIFYSAKRNETISQKYMLLSRFQMEAASKPADIRKEKSLTQATLQLLKKIYPDGSLWGLIVSNPPDYDFYKLEGKKENALFEHTQLSGSQYETIKGKIDYGKPFMGDISEQDGLIPDTHARMFMPLFHRSEKKKALITEFPYFKIFSNVEKEFLFFVCQIIGELFESVAKD